MSRRILVGLFVVTLATIFFLATRGSSSEISVTQTLRQINLIASVNSINVDSAWSQEGGVTRGGAIRLSLDDLRVLTVQDGTLTSNYGSILACTDFARPNSCVFLADMLGDAVVWFALVSADAIAGREFLTLPGLVDMQANGGEGILRNGWVVKLATPVKRECGDTSTSSLRDFISRFPDQLSKTIVNLTTDNVVSVKCK
ncbi:MAG: hypothetical protein JHC65_12425 [Ilumatobacteraceae bacterium]|nr:hypothetical protein [Ilumatobacteraceae bacterium]